MSLVRAGVPVIAGTDAGVNFVPHHGYVGGLRSMAWLGMANDDVLHAATGRAADTLGLHRVTGTRWRRGSTPTSSPSAAIPAPTSAALDDLRFVATRGEPFTPDPLPSLELTPEEQAQRAARLAALLARPDLDGATMITFATEPSAYRHWQLSIDAPVATLTMRVTPEAGLRDDYELKLNSYDLGVDIELHDAVQRLRFEHPEVRAVVVTGGLDKVFCAGANIQMLAGSSHAHKVGFCKFTNETRNSIEDATASSGQVWIAAVNGTAAGGGYELALACDEIVLVDDRSSAVSLPEVPLLAVLPGTGGLTRVVDKRHVRRDLADVFATRAEGVKGQQALDWGLVDAIAPRSTFDATVRERALARAASSARPADATGVALTPLRCAIETTSGATTTSP